MKAQKIKGKPSRKSLPKECDECDGNPPTAEFTTGGISCIACDICMEVLGHTGKRQEKRKSTSKPKASKPKETPLENAIKNKGGIKFH